MQVRGKRDFRPVPGQDCGETANAALAKNVKNRVGDILFACNGYRRSRSPIVLELSVYSIRQKLSVRLKSRDGRTLILSKGALEICQ